MFRATALTAHWKQYLHNHVERLTKEGKLVDPLGTERDPFDVHVFEDSSNTLQAVYGSYAFGGIPCCFYSLRDLETVCGRGRITDAGRINALDLYWFIVEASDHHNKDSTVARWASPNRHLEKSIVMFNDASVALSQQGYSSAVVKDRWVLTKDSQKLSVRKMYPVYAHSVEESGGDEAFEYIYDGGAYVFEVRNVSSVPEHEWHAVPITKIQIDFPTQGIRPPRWELVFDGERLSAG